MRWQFSLRSFFRLLLCASLLSSCRAERWFYYPNRQLYWDPHTSGLQYEVVEYPSLDGAKLTGLFFQTTQEPKGTVVHFHGNFGNVSNHFPQAVFLLNHGFDVLVFDYQGFGGSSGVATRKNTVEDGLASVRYARSRARGGGVAVFGQSLGASVAAVVAARDPEVRGAILEAAFTTYRAIGKDVLRRGFVTWPFSFFAPGLFIRRRFEPIDHVASISPRPVLFVHGDRDKTVPVKMSRELFEKAGEPKQLVIIEGADHLECRRKGGKFLEDELAGFLAGAFSKSTSEK